MWRKIQQTMFVWVCEQQTPKPEHGCKIKTDCFLAIKSIHTSGASHDLSDGQERIENLMADFVRN